MKRCAVFMALALAGCGNEPPKIHKWEAMYSNDSLGRQGYQFVISSPPKGQGELVELIKTYLKNSPPPGFWDGKYGAVFYRESGVTPTDEKQRPKASWWDQSRDGPYIEYKPLDDQEMISARYTADDKRLRMFFSGDYNRTCKANDFAIVDIQADGSQTPTCD